MSRPKIKTALIMAFVLIGLVFGGFAAYSVNRLQVVNKYVSDLATNWMPSVATAKNINGTIATMRMSYRDHLLAVDAEGKANAENALAKAEENFLAQIAASEALYTYQIELDIAKQVRQDMASYKVIGEKLMTLSRAHEDDAAKKVLSTELRPLGTKISVDVDKLIDINVKGAQETYESSQSVYSSSLLVTLVAIAFCVVSIIGAIWFALSGIARPIQTITNAMKTLASGDNASAIPYSGRTDEIGDMAAAVEVFRANALANQRLEEEATAQRSTSDDERRRTAEADRVRAEAMAKATKDLGEGLRQVSSGNLSFQLSDPFATDYESLRSDFNAAISQLRDTLQSVSQATGQIDSGTREISQSAEDLSKRTEQQAASLEETAAALDEITANVSNSSKRADEARSVAVQANTSAAHSGAVVANAVDAMQKIEESSNQVSNIIGVIDEIAFQTNLLALNAGVEAARAGDAGKGFAVVAQEVRELAQRSAKAAKEIKELIRNSSVEVQSGVKLVSETGSALKTIEAYIVTINQHMDAIATSSREQSTGLAEVNTAVNQMDQVTQQNAAMVEESNAASATLASEAGRLRELVSQFQLGNGSSAQASGQHASAQHASALRKTATAMARPSASSAASRQPAPAARAVSHGNTALKQDEWTEF